jgi:hypothetical protein
MNVQDVIEKALNGNEGIPVTPVEHSSCEDAQVEKLASALNFIGANLESSFEALEKVAEDTKMTTEDYRRYGVGGAAAAQKSREMMIRAGMSDEEINKVHTYRGANLRSALRSAGYGMVGSLAGSQLGLRAAGTDIGSLVGGGAGMYLGDRFSEKAELARGKAALKKRLESSKTAALGGGFGAAKGREMAVRAGLSDEELDEANLRIPRGEAVGTLKALGGGLAGGLAGGLVGRAIGGPVGIYAGGGLGYLGGTIAGSRKGYKDEIRRAKKAIQKKQSKTASAADSLYYAAMAGKQSLLEKVAEDRINPAKISAGAAAPYSGEIMPKGENVFGGQMMPSQLVAMKAQKVRARINSDMKKFVNNVGDGYNLQGHLNKMNK